MSDHVLLMDLMPQANKSVVHLDGVDISGFLAGVVVSSHAQGLTHVQLIAAAGRHVQLTAMLPDSAITIQHGTEVSEVARLFVQATREVIEILNRHGFPVPSSLALATEYAENIARRL